MSKEKNFEQVASDYVAGELEQSRKQLKNTKIWGSVGVFALGAWMFGISHGFASNLQPENAAKITEGLIVQKLEEAQPQLSSYLKAEIPKFIEQAPDYAISQLPVYRETVEDDLEGRLEDLASSTSEELDAALDSFLVEHQNEFKTIILAGQDKETTDVVAAAMKEMFEQYLHEPQEDGESISYKLDQALLALNDIEQRTSKLAHEKELSSQDRKLKRAIACLFNTVQENQSASPVPGNWANSLTEAISSAQSVSK